MTKHDFDGLVQERLNSIADALELRLSCTNPSIYTLFLFMCSGVRAEPQFYGDPASHPGYPLVSMATVCHRDPTRSG